MDTKRVIRNISLCNYRQLCVLTPAPLCRSIRLMFSRYFVQTVINEIATFVSLFVLLPGAYLACDKKGARCFSSTGTVQL